MRGFTRLSLRRGAFDIVADLEFDPGLGGLFRQRQQALRGHLVEVRLPSLQFPQTSAGTLRITMTVSRSSNVIVAVPGAVVPCLQRMQVIAAASWS